MTQHPELEKLMAIPFEARQAVGDFIEWLESRGLRIAEHGRGAYSDQLFPALRSRDSLMAEFFEIDLDLLEAERRAMLEALTTGAPDDAA